MGKNGLRQTSILARELFSAFQKEQTNHDVTSVLDCNMLAPLSVLAVNSNMCQGAPCWWEDDYAKEKYAIIWTCLLASGMEDLWTGFREVLHDFKQNFGRFQLPEISQTMLGAGYCE